MRVVSGLSFSGLALALAAGTAAAQTGAGPTASPGSVVKEFEAVTATATKTERSAFDVPASVTVIGTDQLQREQPRDLGSLLEELPGVDVDGGPRAVGEQPNMRGLGTTRMVISIDGARQNFEAGHRGRLFLDPDILKQVEVLRGPGSVLYGSGALGGVIAMTTKDAGDFLRPGENLGGLARVGFQSGSDSFLGSGTVFGRVGSVDGLVSITARESDDVRLGTGRDLPHSSQSILNGLGKIGVTIADYHTIRLTAFGYEDEGPTPSNPSGTPSPTNPLLDRETRQINYNARYSFHDPANDWLRVDATLFDNATKITENRSPAFGAPRRDESEFDTFGFDVRNTATIGRDGPIENVVTIGADWYRDEQTGRRNGLPRTSFADAEAELFGVFVQDEITLFRDWTVTPALRFDSWNTDPSVANRSEQSESRLSPKIALTWRALDWLALYASYAEAFRAPTLVELYSLHPGFITLDASNLRPEVMKNREVGFRLRFDDVLAPSDALRFKFSYYDADVEDLIDTEFNFATFTARNFNVPSAHLNGFEAEGAYDAGWAFASLGASAVRGDDETNNRPLLNIPQDKLIIGLGGRWRPENLTFGWKGKVLFEQDRIPATTATGSTLPRTGASFVQDIYVSWEPEGGMLAGTRIDFGVDNLFDVSYRRHLSAFEEEGVNVKLTLSKRF